MRVEDNTCIGNISEDLIMNNYIADCPIKEIAEDEPYDLQMICYV